MLKKTAAMTGLLIGAAAGALFMSSPAFAGGHHDSDKNINKNALVNKNVNDNDNDNSADADASIDIDVAD